MVKVSAKMGDLLAGTTQLIVDLVQKRSHQVLSV
jgi:hypothetical protein